MKVVTAKPPNYDQICEAFPVRNVPGVVFVHGDTLYRPSGGPAICYHLRAHEETHVRQQAKLGPAAWWDRYIADPRFRLEQEVEAYYNQHRAMSKPDRMKWIRTLAGDLCSPIYGGIVTFDEAKRMIRTGQIDA